MLTKSKPEEARRLLEEAQKDAQTRWRMYEYLAAGRPESAIGSNSAKE
jgi:pyruvate-ferredoxin/flavodoxin oxidoreductase